MISLLLSLALVAAPVPKERSEAEFQKTVDAAREKAIRLLKDNQRADGGWESNQTGMFYGGQSALIALALLEAGVPIDDPSVKKAVEFIQPLKAEQTYVVSLQTQVLARVDPKAHAKQIQTNADWLMKAAVYREKKLRGWSYSTGSASGDNSNSQFAIMGLHAAARAGAKIDPDIWPQIREFYTDTQNNDGGWSYSSTGGGASTYGMTLTGLLGLAVASKYDKPAKDPGAAFDRAMELIVTGRLVLGPGQGPYTPALATAHVGRVLGSNEFKSGKVAKAWHRDGVEQLLKEQNPDGSWRARQAATDGRVPLIATACGLYFLGPPPKK